MEAIKLRYNASAYLNKHNVGGQKWEVDHIIPLQGKIVSGLHIHTNMQIIPKRENCRKSNKFEAIDE